MTVDDYENRVEDYWYWRNREIDAQLDVEAAARSSEIDRLLSGEELRAKYSTGPARVPSNSTNTYLESISAFKQGISTPTAEEQFNTHSERLFVALRNSTFLPSNTVQKWISEIK